MSKRKPNTPVPVSPITVYGHAVEYRLLRKVGGTMEIVVTKCATCPGLVGRFYRVSGLGF